MATTPETIVDDLTRDNFEVLLFLDQAEAPAGALAPLGTLLADPIANFTEEGGSAVILASASGTLEMDEFINAGNMLDNLTGLQPYSFETVYNRAPADSVGKDVLSPFLSLLFSCTFTTTDTPDVDTAFVVTNASPTSGDVGDPMVIHHVLAR